eukprot:6174024-Pleurochrysis_carterae.AAC.1
MLNLATIYSYSHSFTSWDELVGQPKAPPRRNAGRVLRRSHISAILDEVGGWWTGEKKCAPMPVPVDIVRAIVSVCSRATLPR